MKKKLVKQEEALGVDDEDTLTTVKNSIGIFLQEQGKLKEAETYYRRALEGRQRILGRDHPNTVNSVSNLVLQQQGKLKEAEALPSPCSRRTWADSVAPSSRHALVVQQHWRAAARSGQARHRRSFLSSRSRRS